MSDSIDFNTLFSAKNPHLNITLLKKIVALGANGILQINGQLPNDAYQLRDYLFSKGTFTVDVSSLDLPTRLKFEKWLFDPHMNDNTESYFHDVYASDFRGYTSETKLSWWGRILNFFFYRKASLNWSISPLELNTKNQLTNMYCSLGKNGFLVGFNFLNLPNLLNFQQETDIERINDQPNSKRIKITPQIIEALTKMDIDAFDANNVLKQKHPLSISVPENKKTERQTLMDEYRFTHLYQYRNPWYKRLWAWFLSFLGMSSTTEKKQSSNPKSKRCFSESILESADELKFKCSIKFDPKSGAVQVIEECEPIDSIVYSGGGGKIFAHVGALAALEDNNIHCKNFAGSSAGAIMALLGYLGYTSSECKEFFQAVNKDVLIHYDIDWDGLSDPRALKALIDYAVNKKVLQIIEQYKLEDCKEGRGFLENKVFINGVISFQSLHNLKKQLPDCSIKNCLKVTTTNQTKNKSMVSDLENTPTMEVSEAVKISASIPPVYKSTIIDGEAYTDGGVLRNFPIEIFRDHYNTLLNSQHGTHLGTIGFCFDSGVARKPINNFRLPIYKEHPVINFVYSIITGVNDPASGWAQDRNKLNQNSHQVVFLPANVSSTKFTVSPAEQQELFYSGYAATTEYLSRFYDSRTQTLEQHMYEIYPSIEALMVQCTIRGKREVFDALVSVAKKHGISASRIKELEGCHTFKDIAASSEDDFASNSANYTHQPIKNGLFRGDIIKRLRMFDALYPIFLMIKPQYFSNNSAQYSQFKKARHYMSPLIYTPVLQELSKLKGSQHLIISILKFAMDEFTQSSFSENCKLLKTFSLQFRKNEHLLTRSDWFFDWQLNENQMREVIQLIIDDKFDDCFRWIQNHQREKTVSALKPHSFFSKTPELSTKSALQDPIACS